MPDPFYISLYYGKKQKLKRKKKKKRRPWNMVQPITENIETINQLFVFIFIFFIYGELLNSLLCLTSSVYFLQNYYFLHTKKNEFFIFFCTGRFRLLWKILRLLTRLLNNIFDRFTKKKRQYIRLGVSILYKTDKPILLRFLSFFFF